MSDSLWYFVGWAYRDAIFAVIAVVGVSLLMLVVIAAFKHLFEL